MIRTNLIPSAAVLVQDASRSLRGRRIAALAVPLLVFAMGACDPDPLTGPHSQGTSGLPHQPTPIECPGDAIGCYEQLF